MTRENKKYVKALVKYIVTLLVLLAWMAVLDFFNDTIPDIDGYDLARSIQRVILVFAAFDVIGVFVTKALRPKQKRVDCLLGLGDWA
jgi:hypothetical protein